VHHSPNISYYFLSAAVNLTEITDHFIYSMLEVKGVELDQGGMVKNRRVLFYFGL
jgi:hypothetical protein